MVTDSPDSFLLSLNISNFRIKALLDSGATHCFIDSSLISDHRLPITLLPQPMRLRLFNGSYATEPILYEVTIPVYFTPAKVLSVSFLVTPLDPDVSAVLGLCWLRQYNPLVDWANNRIEFRTPDISTPVPPAPPCLSTPPAFSAPPAFWLHRLLQPLQPLWPLLPLWHRCVYASTSESALNPLRERCCFPHAHKD
jgi:hypothetical protein